MRAVATCFVRMLAGMGTMVTSAVWVSRHFAMVATPIGRQRKGPLDYG